MIKLGDKRCALVLIVDMSNYRKGAKAFREGDFKTAEVNLLRHIELNPDAVKARVILGRIYGAGNETKKAEVNYKDALRFDPDYEEAYLRLGALYLSAGQFQQAKDIYDDGLNHLPDSKSLRTGLEKTKKRLSAAKVEPQKKETAGGEPRDREIPQTDAGKRQVLKADDPKKEMPVSEASNNGPALIGTSRNTHERKIHIRIILTEKESDALDILSQVKKGRPFALLAKERSVDERTREACGYLGEVGVDSLHPSIQEALSKLKEGQTSDAIRMDQNRYAIVQVTDMGLYTEGERAFIAGDYVTAEAKLLRYVETNPDAVKARTMLGKIYENKEEPSKAIEMYKEAISFSPKTVLIYERLARVYLFMGMYLKAKEVYVQGLRQVPSSPVFEEGIEMADMLLIGGENAVIREIERKSSCIVLCLAALFLWSSVASADRPASKAKHAKKKVEKTVNQEKTGNYKERSAITITSSSDVFLKNSQESERVTQVLLGDEFTVIKEDKDWAYGYIPSQKGYRGWIKKNNISFSSPGSSPAKSKTFVQVKNATARITFRDGSFINVYAGTRLPLLNKDNRRYEVVVPDGSTGYLPLEAAWMESERLGKEVTAEDILQASKFHGSDYKWGGITTGGMDCSGFVYTAFRLNGIYLKRDSYLQAEEGLDVPIDELKAGDLVFFKSEKANRITHVGIYIGNGNFIHSSGGKRGVAVSSLSEEHFKNHFSGARRVLNRIDSAIKTKQDKERAPGPQNESET